MAETKTYLVYSAMDFEREAKGRVVVEDGLVRCWENLNGDLDVWMTRVTRGEPFNAMAARVRTKVFVLEAGDQPEDVEEEDTDVV